MTPFLQAPEKRLEKSEAEFTSTIRRIFEGSELTNWFDAIFTSARKALGKI